MTPEQTQTEWLYRVRERVGLLVEDLQPPPEWVVQLAIREADEWKHQHDTHTPRTPGTHQGAR